MWRGSGVGLDSQTQHTKTVYRLVCDQLQLQLVQVFMVPLMATQHQPASWVFGSFETAAAVDVGIVNPL